MSAELIILGLLKEKPLYGYELKQIFHDRGMDQYTKLSFGSIYFALGKLEKNRMVEKKSEKDSKRPERFIYEITEKGIEEFNKLLLSTYDEFERIYYKFDVALSFLKEFGKKEALEKLIKRKEIIEEIVFPHLDSQKKRLEGNIPYYELSILDHTIFHLKAEHEWLLDLINKINLDINKKGENS